MALEDYGRCKTCGRDQLAFSLAEGECYSCRGVLTFEKEPCDQCEETE